jgi:hypothetical protein
MVQTFLIMLMGVIPAYRQAGCESWSYFDNKTS